MAVRAELTRGLRLWPAIAINVGNMIGAGVFIKSRVMTCNVGSAGAVLAVWLGSGLLVLAGSFAYTEVAALFPEAGGEYIFLRRAYGRFAGFLFGWTCFGVMRTGAQAALAVSFTIFLNVALGGLLAHPLGTLSVFGHGLSVTLMPVVAMGVIWVVAIICCATVAMGGNTAFGLTAAKVAVLLAIGIAAFIFGDGNWNHLAQGVGAGTCDGVRDSARGGIAGIGAAMLGALWAYDGWSNVTPLLGEIRDPERTIPKVFIRGMLLVGALYMFANLSYFYVLSPEQIASVSTSSSVATEVLRRFMGPIAVSLIAVALMLSSFGSLQASILSNARVPFAMARDGLFFRGLAALSPRTHVPVRAILAQATWASLLALSGTYDTLTDAVIFASFLFYGLAAGSVFVLRRRFPNAVRPYRAFGYPWAPALFVLVTVFLLVNTFVATPREALEGIAVLLVGIPFYAYWSRRRPAAAVGAAGD
jgi:basic amino acid/polyamine antiporter, APA family